MDFEDACFQVAWADFDETSIFPSVRPKLAHYTSISVLESMLDSEQLWLSHPLLMNDHQELIWGMQQGREALISSSKLWAACRSQQRFELLIDHFTNLYDDYGSGHAKDLYVACFSEHDAADSDGLLSMWRGYASNGGGVAVVFDTSKLTPEDESPFVLGPISYQSDDDRVRMLDGIVESLSVLIDKEEPDENGLRCVASNYFERLKLFAVFTKHRGFSEEKEWRLAYLRDRDPHRKYEQFIGYHISNDHISVKMKVDIRNVGDPNYGYNFDSLVYKVIVGPRASSVMSVYAINRMLMAKGRDAFLGKICECGTPFRG